MKSIYFLTVSLLIQLFFSCFLNAQHSISIDIGGIRQKNNHQKGINISSFYHVNQQLLAGLEANHFFPVHRSTNEGEDIRVSGWDIEMNLHYLLSLRRGLRFYPITGISHTSEREINISTQYRQGEQFWSVNTGVGINTSLGHWLPHIEYIFSWGRIRQQFILAGVGYEIEWRSRHQP